MIPPTPGPLRPPRSAGFMSANMVLPLYEVLGQYVSQEERNRLYSDAGLRYLPGPEDPVREKQVSKLHQSIRLLYPELSKDIFEEAAVMAADIVAEYRIPVSGKMMLRRLPWPLATWMLVRSAQQNAWTFGGSGTFEAHTTAQVSLSHNPITRGETSSAPVCHFHRTLFERLFRLLVHPRMTCTEHQCEASGGSACKFELRVDPDKAMP